MTTTYHFTYAPPPSIGSANSYCRQKMAPMGPVPRRGIEALKLDRSCTQFGVWCTNLADNWT